MRKILLGLIAILVLGGLFVWGTSKTQTYRNENIGIAFTYPSVYVLQEHDAVGGDMSHQRITLINEADAEPRENSEGPTAITLDVWKVGSTTPSLLSWLKDSPDSNFALGTGAYSSTTVSRQEALEYSWSGLYEGKSTAVLRGDTLYNFSVTRITPEDIILKDFEEMLKTVEFLN